MGRLENRLIVLESPGSDVVRQATVHEVLSEMVSALQIALQRCSHSK